MDTLLHRLEGRREHVEAVCRQARISDKGGEPRAGVDQRQSGFTVCTDHASQDGMGRRFARWLDLASDPCAKHLWHSLL
mgnify:CR=1 FL=1